MSTPSNRQRPLAVAPDWGESGIHLQSLSSAGVLTIPDRPTNNSVYPWWPRRLLYALSPAITWRWRRRDDATLTRQYRTLLFGGLDSAWRKFILLAKGKEGHDIFSSPATLCSAFMSFFFGLLLFGNASGTIGSWVQILWISSMGIWVFSFCIYIYQGTPANMSPGRQKGLLVLTMVLTVIALWLLPQLFLLPGVAGIPTLSTWAAQHIQTLFLGRLRSSPRRNSGTILPVTESD